MPVHATSQLKRQAQLLQRHLPQRTSNTTASILRRPSLTQAVTPPAETAAQSRFLGPCSQHPHPSVLPARLCLSLLVVLLLVIVTLILLLLLSLLLDGE